MSTKFDGFKERLIKYRESKPEFKTKTAFSKWLGVNINLLSMLETGYRTPSDAFIDNLVLKTGLPEEYWVYGITREKEYLDSRADFKVLRRAIDDALDLNLIDLEGKFTSDENEKIFNSLIESALKADVYHILLKKKKQVE